MSLQLDLSCRMQMQFGPLQNLVIGEELSALCYNLFTFGKFIVCTSFSIVDTIFNAQGIENNIKKKNL